MKRTIIFIALLFSLIPALAFATPTTETASGGPVKVTIWTGITGVGQEGQTKVLYSSTPIGKMTSALTGVDWEFNYSQAADYDTAFNLRLAANDWTEVINWNGDFAKLQKLIDAGVVVPADKYYHNKKYPNIALARESMIKYWTYTDGHIYNFPSGVYQDEKQPWGYWAAAVWCVRPDYLQAVGMTTADLKTTAGVEKFLRAVKEKGLKTADGLPVYGMSSGENVSFARIIMNTFGVSTAGQGFEKVGSEYVHFRDNPQTKAAFQWLNTLWNDGLIDPEALSLKNETLREKMMGKRVALQADWAWPYWQTVTSGKTAVTEMVLLEYPTAPGATKPGVNVTYNPNGSGGLVLTKFAKNPEAVVRHVNEVWKDFNPATPDNDKWEHQLTIQYGTRGILWDWDPNVGKPYYVYKGDLLAIVGDYNKMVQMGYAMNPLIVQGNDSNYFTASLTEALDWIFKMHKFYYNKPNVSASRPYDSLKMPADGLWSKNSEILGRLDVEHWAKIISAPKASFEAAWKTYQDQLELQGSWSKVRAEWLATAKTQVK